MSTDLRLWSYAETAPRIWGDVCAESLERCHPGAVTRYDRDGFEAAYSLDTGAPPAWDNWLPSQRAAFVCAYLLHEHGGAWVEPDVVLFRPLYPVFAALDHFDFIAPFPYYVRTEVDTCLLFSRPGGEVIRRFLAAMRLPLGDTAQTFGTVMPLTWLDGIFITMADKVPLMKLPGRRVRPMTPARLSVDAAIRGTDTAHAARFPENALACAAGYSAGGGIMRMDRDELLASDTLLGYIMRRGIGA